MKAAEFLRPEGWLGEACGPRCLQLRQRLHPDIETGKLSPNSSLPSKREIAEITDLSRGTVRKAKREQVREEMIEQWQGSGSVVREPMKLKERSLSHLISFTKDMAGRGLDTTSRWLERGIFPAAPDGVATLSLQEREQVARICRLREAGGRQMALERAALPPDILPNPLEVKTSRCSVLERTGHRPTSAIQESSAMDSDASAEDRPGMAEGDAILSIERKSFLKSGRVAEPAQSRYRGDGHDFVTELWP